jgi:hypothetical protein
MRRTVLLLPLLLVGVLFACGGGDPVGDSNPGDAGDAGDAGAATTSPPDASVSIDSGSRKDASADECPIGSITFVLETKTGAFCTGPVALGCTNDSPWINIFEASGPLTTVVYAPSCGVTNCGSCETESCPKHLCEAPIVIPPEGIQTTWTGVRYAGDTCKQNGSSLSSCQKAFCVAPGHYVARMCGYLADGDATTCGSASPTPTCTDVPFDWPMTSTLTGTL